MAILTFSELLSVMDTRTPSQDLVSCLPTEVASKIFRYLDADSLVAAAMVNRRWKSVCKWDRKLRTAVRRRLRAERKTGSSFETLIKSRGVRVVATGQRRLYGPVNGNSKTVREPNGLQFLRRDTNNNAIYPQRSAKRMEEYGKVKARPNISIAQPCKKLRL